MRKTSNYLIALAVIVTALAIPLLYVLSTGPAFWLSHNGYVDESRLPTVYRPIHWGIWKSDPFRRFMWSYLALWDESIEFMSVDPFCPPVRLEEFPELATPPQPPPPRDT